MRTKQSVIQSQWRMRARVRARSRGRVVQSCDTTLGAVRVRRKLERDPTLRSSVSVGPVVCGAHSSRQMRSPSLAGRRTAVRLLRGTGTTPSTVILCSDTLLLYGQKHTITSHCTFTPGFGADRSLTGTRTTNVTETTPVGSYVRPGYWSDND